MTTITQEIAELERLNRVLTRLTVLRIVIGTLAGASFLIWLAI